MKITFLGTSHGVPSEERYCQSMLLEIGENAYLIDAGAPVMNILLRRHFDLNRLKAIFLTHMHGDHTHGLPELLDLSCWYFKTTDYDVYMTEEGRMNAILTLLDRYPNPRIRPHLIGPGFTYEKDGLKVTAFPNGHMIRENRPAYSYLIEAEGKRLYISGDLNPDTIDYPAEADEKPSDAMVVECAHFPAEKLLEKLQNCKAGKIIIVHVHPVSKYETFIAAQDTFGRPLLLPNDGDTIEI